MKNALTLRKHGTAVAKAAKQIPAQLAHDGLNLSREYLSGKVAQHFHVASVCVEALKRRYDWLSWLGISAPTEEVERAKIFYRAKLPDAGRIYSANEFLHGLQRPRGLMDPNVASAMLHFLFSIAVRSKRDNEERMLKLMTCVDMFSETNNMLGKTTGLWNSVPQHPTLLALAIKQLQAEQTFEPSEPELREVLRKAEEKARSLGRNADEWLTRMRDTDAIMFKVDRDAWRAAHAAVGSEATLAMIDHYDTPYAEALEEIWEPKFYREHPEELEREAMFYREHPEKLGYERPAHQERDLKLERRFACCRSAETDRCCLRAAGGEENPCESRQKADHAEL